jgi:hypothetical protein
VQTGNDRFVVFECAILRGLSQRVGKEVTPGSVGDIMSRN